MKKNEASKAANATYEVARKTRGDWNGINPVTKIIPNKKKNPKIKHKGRQYED